MHEAYERGIPAFIVGEHVKLPRLRRANDTAGVVTLHGLEPFLHCLRLLESPLIAEPPHLLLKHAFELHRVAVENLAHPVYVHAVFLRGNLADAAASAFLDMVVEAEAVFPPRYRTLFKEMAAAAQREYVAYELEHHLCRLHIAVRAVILSRLRPVACHEDAGEKLFGDHNPRI